MKPCLLPALALVLIGFTSCDSTAPSSGAAPTPARDELLLTDVQVQDDKTGGKTITATIESVPGATIEVPTVRVDTYFFLQQPTGEILLSSERFGAQWKSAPIDWQEGAAETLEATVPKSTKGTYYGYIIGVYHKGALQDLRSQPEDLIKSHPLATASPVPSQKK